jgi:hypothetical protein
LTRYFAAALNNIAASSRKQLAQNFKAAAGILSTSTINARRPQPPRWLQFWF